MADTPYDRETVTALASLWEQFRDAELARVEVLELAITDLLAGSLTEDRRRQAAAEAHKIAGSVGTFGFTLGSELAREMEKLLLGSAPLGQAQTLRLSQLVVDLRTELESPPPQPASAAEAQPSTSQPAASDGRRFLLFVDHDLRSCRQIVAEATARGMRVEVADNLERARQVVNQERPDIVLLDPMFPDGHDDGMAFLRELGEREPPVPVVVFTETKTFLDRVQVATLGGRGFLSKSASATDAIDVVARVLRQARPEASRILVVDDDPAMLAILESLLTGRGMQVATLDDPLRFWTVLEQMAPDLVMLDVDMPDVNGIELCQVMRNDVRWSTLPVIVLTARADSETVRRVFEAGADDFVSKPVVGPELIARISNRLERSRLYQSIADNDPLTGLANRRKAAQSIRQYLRLAERQGQPFSVAVLDLDHFKRVNDRYGHGAGDAVLQSVGRLLARSLRCEDVVARWGGEEFLIGMYGMTRLDGVQRLADTLDLLRHEAVAISNGEEIHVTFSGGVAEFPADGSDLQALYRAADEALYTAKAVGRDRVVPVGWNPAEEEGRAGEDADVVVVDDDEVLGSLLVHTLETRGYRTQWLKDGTVAASALSGAAPAVAARAILLDVDLPGLNGFALLQRLAESGVTRHSRVIMLTVRATEDEVVKALEMGAFDHVAKPFSLPILMQRVRRALEVA